MMHSNLNLKQENLQCEARLPQTRMLRSELCVLYSRFYGKHSILPSSSSRMRVIYHNWSAMKQRPHPQSVAEIQDISCPDNHISSLVYIDHSPCTAC